MHNSEHFTAEFETGNSTGLPSEAISKMHSGIRIGLGADPCTVVIGYFFQSFSDFLRTYQQITSQVPLMKELLYRKKNPSII